MSLGEVLTINIKSAEKEKRNLELEHRMENDPQFKECFYAISSYFDDARKHISEEIMNGSSDVSISTRDIKSKNVKYELSVFGISPNHTSQFSQYSIIWDDFVGWLKRNGLRVKTEDCTDKEGMWMEFHIKPV